MMDVLEETDLSEINLDDDVVCCICQKIATLVVNLLPCTHLMLFCAYHAESLPVVLAVLPKKTTRCDICLTIIDDVKWTTL